MSISFVVEFVHFLMFTFSYAFLILIDQVKPIRELVFSWQKMEFNSWPALLDEVQDQCEVNAGKVNQSYL